MQNMHGRADTAGNATTATAKDETMFEKIVLIVALTWIACAVALLTFVHIIRAFGGTI